MGSGRLFRGEHVDTDDDGDLQTVTLMGPQGETLKKVHRVQHFGFSSSVPKGSHGMGVQFGGADGGRVLNAVLGLEHQDHRPKKTKPGQSVVYDQKGNVSRYLGGDGIWHDAGDRLQKITGKTITVTGTDKVVCEVGGMKVIIRKNRIDLGGEGGSAVMTEAGPSKVVFAKV